MRHVSWLIVACLTLALATHQRAHAQDSKSDRHAWTDITYPNPPPAAVGSLVPKLSLRNGKHDGLQLIVGYVFREDDESQKKLPSLEKTLVRLHTGDGKVADSKPRDGGVVGNLGMHAYSFEYTFAWRSNLLEEAWIEVRLPGQAYWVEVPYGFTRDPADSLSPVEARRGSPKYLPTMKPGKADWLVPWLDVSYDLGKIQNGWSAYLNITNSFSPAFEVLLYRDDFGNERNGHLWNIDSPRTAMEIKLSGEGLLGSKRMGIRLHDDRMRRTDSFKLDKSYTGTRRRWGTVVVSVDDKVYGCVVPSSLFWEQHGATAHGEHYKAFVPRLRER